MADKNTVFQQKLSVNIGGELLDFANPKVMGILNLTPDSFYDGGKNNSVQTAIVKTQEMIDEGADIIDVGAYSSRPGADHVSDKEERTRLIPVIKAIRKEFPNVTLSVDTFRSELAKEAITEGANLINDISAGELDPNMFEAMAALGVPYIIMHMKGNPQTMTSKTTYQDISTEIALYFSEKINRLKSLGLKDLIIDPGFGFAKTMDQNYELLNKLDHLRICGHPILVGLSRKSMIYKLLETDPEQALNGTISANTLALLKGANMLRVHDVKAAKQVIKIVSMLNASA